MKCGEIEDLAGCECVGEHADRSQAGDLRLQTVCLPVHFQYSALISRKQVKYLRRSLIIVGELMDLGGRVHVTHEVRLTNLNGPITSSPEIDWLSPLCFTNLR